MLRGAGLALVASLLVLGAGAFWYYLRTGDAPAATPALVAESNVLAAAPSEKSIAVLPFVNMSSEAEQEYLSDGIAEQLLTLLAKIPELRVISRLFSFLAQGRGY